MGTAVIAATTGTPPSDGEIDRWSKEKQRVPDACVPIAPLDAASAAVGRSEPVDEVDEEYNNGPHNTGNDSHEAAADSHLEKASFWHTHGVEGRNPARSLMFNCVPTSTSTHIASNAPFISRP